MAIFLDENSKVIVQGMTGSEGRKHTQLMLKGGTNIVVEREGALTDRVVKRSTYYRHHVDLKLVLPSSCLGQTMPSGRRACARRITSSKSQRPHSFCHSRP